MHVVASKFAADNLQGSSPSRGEGRGGVAGARGGISSRPKLLRRHRDTASLRTMSSVVAAIHAKRREQEEARQLNVSGAAR